MVNVVFVKWLSINSRERLLIFVCTDLQKGGGVIINAIPFSVFLNVYVIKLSVG